ncbi:phage tail sheath subtilisin-like domain-containing protein [Clostridium hydrogenum]|uniref:phage tail sheath subtilisin-like domain-containing protein n=1 Tax=Clostridium hydrogenum TaxID=2855764 RepID=UPI001F38A419|nr:phage tail sheath subtilisin-like domain-containing protein [Clostridium hydrogenum]
MNLPNINIAFKDKANTTIRRGERGIVALVLKDAVPSVNPIIVKSEDDIPASLTADNKEQIELALIGGENVPEKVIVYIVAADAADFSAALNYLETTKFDYLAIPSIDKTDDVVAWVKQLRDSMDIKIKAVLPHTTADYEGVIDFDTDNISANGKTYTAAQYCSRIAGILAGTPLNISATYSVLKEVEDVPHLSKTDGDNAVAAGKLILINDGEKCKIGRAVNSLVTTDDNKGEDFKKILIVDKNDMWHNDVKMTVSDFYLGKYPNNYDNKILLIAAIQGYNDQLAVEGLLDNSLAEYNKVTIDIDAQEVYLESIGTDTSSMKEQEIKEANTKDKVFLASNLKWTDAMEDFNINVTI